MKRLHVALIVLLAAPVLALSVSPAFAHKVIASVYPSGDVIEGDIGFSNGDMAFDVVVEVFDAAGNKLGETKTNADGVFTYKPTQRVPLVFRANLGAGHVAEVRMRADELPGVEVTGSSAASTANDKPAAGPVASANVDVAALMAEQRKMIDEAVQRQVTPLRREIMAYQEKTNLQAILGGIGYILGLFGIGFYFAGRRKLKGA